MRLLNNFLDLFFPITCLLCEKGSVGVCDSCLSKLLLYQNSDTRLQSFIHPVFSYKDPQVKKLIWALKYSNKKSVAPCLAKCAADTVSAIVSELCELSGATEVLVVPIPLHQKRYREREYNQSELLVNHLVLLDKTKIVLPKYNLLLRKTFSLPNARTHSRSERITNTLGSFEVNTDIDIKNKYILLVDDVVTTGTTLGEARKVLLRAGARDVFAVTLAH